MGFDFGILLFYLFILNIIMKGTKAVAEKSARLTLKELLLFNYTGSLIQVHGHRPFVKLNETWTSLLVYMT